MIVRISSLVASRIACASLRSTVIAPRRAMQACLRIVHRARFWQSAAQPPAPSSVATSSSLRRRCSPGAQLAELERAQAHAFEAQHRVAHGLAHPPHLPVAAFADRDLEPSRPSLRTSRRRGRAVVERARRARSCAQRARAERSARDARAVGLGHLEARVGEPVRELAVVREQDQTRAVGVEASHRVQPAPLVRRARRRSAVRAGRAPSRARRRGLLSA